MGPNRRTVLAAGLALAATARPAFALDKVSVAASSVSMLSLPVYVADVSGIAKKHGIEIEQRTFKGGATALAAVLSGGADFYLGATSSAVRAASRGTGALIVATLTSEYAINIVVKKSAVPGITDGTPLPQRLAALKGLRIGVTGPGSGTHQIVRYVLEQQKLDENRDATIAFIGSGEQMLAAMQAKNVDGLAAASPTSDVVVEEMDGVMLVRGASGEYPGLQGFPFISVISTARWTDAHPELTARFIKVLSESAGLLHGDAATVAKMRDEVRAKFFKATEKKVFDAGWATMTPSFRADLTPTTAQVEAAIKFLNRFSDDKITAKASEVMTTKFLPKG